jgi:hypothetical protein
MWFWRKRKKEHKVQAAVQNYLMQTIIKVQRRWADKMQQIASRWSIRRKKTYCIVFCVLSGGYSVFVLMQTFMSKPPEVSVRQVTTPQKIALPPSSEALPRLSVSDTIAYRHFRKVIDSLSQTTEGRQQLHDFFQQRPGMVDSLKMLEKWVH